MKRLVLALISRSVTSTAQFSIQLGNPTINTATGATIYIYPTSPTLYLESKIVVTFPAHLGFTYASTTASCSEMPATLTTSNYVNRQPICEFSTSASNEILLTITNLRTTGTTQPSYYGLYFTGLTTGPAARFDQINGAGGTYATTYVGSVAKESINSNNYVFYQVYKSSGVSVTGNPAQNNVQATFTCSFSVEQPIVTTGSLTISVPYQNYQYSSLGIAPVRSMVSSLPTVTGSYLQGSSKFNLSPTVTVTQQTSQTLIIVMLQNSAVIPSGAVLTIILSKLLMPPSLAPFSGINVNTGDADLYIIEEIDDLSLTNTLPGTEYTTSYTSVASITTLTGVLEPGQTYAFKVYLTGDMPMNSFFTLSVPSIVGMPSSGASGLSITCQQYCDASKIVMSYANSLLTFTNVVPTESDYIVAPGALQFQITGFTNPASTSSAYFIFTSYAVLDTGTFMIDQISNMHINAVQGVCTIKSFIPGDGNYQIYGVAQMWNVTMYCEHAFQTTYGIQITFPDDWYVIDTTTCTVWSQSTNYACAGSSSTGKITITSMFKAATTKNQVFSFQFNSVRNPTAMGYSYDIGFAVTSNLGGVIDQGSFAFAKTLIVKGSILSFTVKPQNFGVGQYPTYYDFVFRPSGEIYKGAYVVLTLPDQVSIYNQIQFETMCSYNISGFTTQRINCKLNGNKVTINTGFTYAATSTMLDLNQMQPPVIKFTLPQFRNHRTMLTSDAFGLQVFASSGTEIYTWNQIKVLTINGVAVTNITYGPCVQMYTAASPQRVIISRGSTVNGAITDYNITVQTTNYLTEGDQIVISLPSPVFFSETSRCLGASNNLRMNQTYTVAVGLNSMKITLLLPLSFRMLQGGSTRTIAAGESFTLTLTQVKNSYTTAPTDSSVVYSEYTGGNLIEQLSSGLVLQNTLPGQFNTNNTSILPADFRQSFATNYTLTFQPVNYQQSMVIILALPKQITFSTNDVICTGLQGTDSPTLKCIIGSNKTYLNITDAVQFQSGNPGTIKIQFSSFINPNTNLITDSFNLTTYSNKGWILDSLTTGLQVNFYCQYPCASCDKLNKTACQSCYAASQYQYWFDFQCLSVCPVTFTNTSNNCTACQLPCSTCTSPTECLTCVPGYNLIGTTCQQVIYWPFPYVFTSILFFFVILCSEICTKKESKFKESLIALVSLPEISSWVTYLVFHYFKKGYTNISFLFGAIALLCYIIINTLHAFVHPRAIVPKSPASYKLLAQNHKCNTLFVRGLSYVLSFKYSLLLVSYLCMQPKYRGDYNEENYRQFYKFGLAFILVPYPLMVFSCSYYLHTEGLFSYTSFAAIEVIAISTLLACIMFLDSLSVVKSNKQTKTQNGFKIKASAQDYESDLEGKKSARMLKQRDANAEFGVDQTNQLESQPFNGNNLTGMNEEYLQQQMQLLEELAKQMRLEKQQLRQERDRIERERRAMSEQTQLREMHSYLNDDSYSRLHSRDGTSGILREKEGDSNLAFLALQEQLSTQNQRRPYFDVEHEQMRDEIISEKDSEESVFIDKVQMPLPITEKVALSFSDNVNYQEPAQAYLSESVRSSVQNELIYLPRDLYSAERTKGTIRSLKSMGYQNGSTSFWAEAIHIDDQQRPDFEPLSYPVQTNFDVIAAQSQASQQSFIFYEVHIPTHDAHFELVSQTLSEETQCVAKLEAAANSLDEESVKAQNEANPEKIVQFEISRPQPDAVLDYESERKSVEATQQFNAKESSFVHRKGTYLDELHQKAQQLDESSTEHHRARKSAFDANSLYDSRDQQDLTDRSARNKALVASGSIQIGQHDKSVDLQNQTHRNFKPNNSLEEANKHEHMTDSEQLERTISKTDKIHQEAELLGAQIGDNEKQQSLNSCDQTQSQGLDTSTLQKEKPLTEIEAVSGQKNIHAANHRSDKVDGQSRQLDVYEHGEQSKSDASFSKPIGIRLNQEIEQSNEPLDLTRKNKQTAHSRVQAAKTAKYGTKLLDYNQEARPESGKQFKKQKLEANHVKPNGVGQSVEPLQSSNAVNSMPSNKQKPNVSFSRGSGTTKFNKSQTKQLLTLKDIVTQDIAEDSQVNQPVASALDMIDERKPLENQNDEASSYGLSESNNAGFNLAQGSARRNQTLVSEKAQMLQTAESANNKDVADQSKHASELKNDNARDSQSEHEDSRPELKSQNKPLDSKLVKFNDRQILKKSSTSLDPFGVEVEEVDAANASRQRQQPQAEYMDQSGHSESSEGIVDHNPFTSASYIQKEIQQYAPTVVATTRNNKIIYSDKSESSFEELMGDTPSNYNVVNGRLDGKSEGLKALVTLQQKQPTNQLHVPPKQSLGQMISGNRRMSEIEQLKFVSQMGSSREGGWGNVNQPLSKKTLVVGEESGDEVIGPRKKKAIKTNKQFAESLGRNQQQSKTPAPAVRHLNQLQSEIRKNNFV